MLPVFLATVCLAIVCLPKAALAQDPYSTLPRNYRVEFENEHVRISHVKYFRGDKLPEHSHPARPTVYVYLDDGDAIRFVHRTPRFTITRPPVKAGSVRFNRNAQTETHEVEYLGSRPTEYLRVELKTVPGPRHRDARLRRRTDFPWEDEMVRIDRVEGSAAPLRGKGVFIDVRERRFYWLPAESTPPRSRLGVLIQLKTSPEARARDVHDECATSGAPCVSNVESGGQEPRSAPA